MIKAVLFDFGGVLTEGGKLGSIRGMFALAYGVRPQDVKLDGSVQAAFKGTISGQEFVDTINRINPQYPPTTTAVLVENADFFERCEQVYALARQLRAKGIVTGIFSNVFTMSAEVLLREGFYDGFAPLVLSCEHRLMKPEKELYEYAIRELKLEPAEIAFIDDRDEFLAPARGLGMHTILAESPDQIVASTAALIAQENKQEL
jgi:putative hydrolase of the HAD superfamily